MTATSIRAIFFDFDGVLTTDPFGSHSTISALARLLSVSEEAVGAAYFPLVADLVEGKRNHLEVLPILNDLLGKSMGFEVLIQAFDQTPINLPMLKLAERLATEIRVGIITDNPSDRMSHITQFQRLDSVFDPIVVSSSLGMSKRSPAIFKHALRLVGISPSQSIFVDNSTKNVEVAAALGMNAIYHDDKRNDISKLENTLVKGYSLLAGAT